MENTKGTELTLSFNLKGYHLLFTGEIGCAYIDAFFLGDKDPFTAINCWDQENGRSNVISILAFVDRIAAFVDDNADDLSAYYLNR